MKYTPISIDKLYIYDILYNDNNEYVIITVPNITYDIKLEINNDLLSSKIYTCPYNQTKIFIFSSDIYKDDIIIYINNYKINTKVNKYPSFKNEIIMSSCVKNEDNYIIQWIEYHKLLGITKFIIYDNKNNKIKRHSHTDPRDKYSNLEKKLEYYINNNMVILIDWPYDHYFQPSQQTHSIHTFKQSQYIGLLDIDEYINIKNDNINLSNIFKNYINNKNIDFDKFGGFTLLSKFFHNPEKINEENYNFLNCFNCGDILYDSYQKVFVNPRCVYNFSTHIITNGYNNIIVDPIEISINHYLFLNKNNRGTSLLPNKDDSIINITKLLK